MSPERVHALLNPTSIAVVGASDTSPWSRGFVRNIEKSGTYDGALYMVNPRRAEAHGRATYPSMASIGEPVDHALVLVGAERVLGVLEDAAAAGVHSATVLASGFAEAGERGQRIAAEVREFCRRNQIAMVGPNCYGFNNYAGTFVSRYNIDVPSIPGAIGLAIQSGQVGNAVADAASARGVRLRYLVSTGNETVTDTNDYFEYFLGSDDISVLGAVMERIPQPDRFAQIARRALDLGKPIVVLKLGRSAAASKIAKAHTGSITGSDSIVDAFLKDCGVLRTDSPEELAETVGLLASHGWPRGARTFFAGFSGGAAGLFADEASTTHLEIIEHTPQTRSALAEASTLDPSLIHNPFDMTVDGGVHFARIAEAMAAAPECDIVVMQGQPLRSFSVANLAKVNEIHEGALMSAVRAHGKYGVFLDTGDHQPGLGVFEHEPAEGARYLLGRNGVQALSNAARYGIARAALLDADGPERVAVDQSLVPAALAEGVTLSEVDGKALLKAYGIPVTEDLLAHDADEAAVLAERVGYPVVLKVLASEITHKSEAGGVIVGLTDPSAVRSAFDQIMTSVGAYLPRVEIDGVIVSRQVVGGMEFLAGVTSDPEIGPVVVAGLGGIFVEVFKDIAMATAPLTRNRARRMLDELASAPILHGTRGRPPLDIDAFVDVLCRLGQLAADHRGRIEELDINPLMVLPAGEGVIALDALVVGSASRHLADGQGPRKKKDDV